MTVGNAVVVYFVSSHLRSIEGFGWKVGVY